MANKDVEHYSYRIEFQVRGLPHLHGVFWLKETEAKKCPYTSNTLTKTDKELRKCHQRVKIKEITQ